MRHHPIDDPSSGDHYAAAPNGDGTRILIQLQQGGDQARVALTVEQARHLTLLLLDALVQVQFRGGLPEAERNRGYGRDPATLDHLRREVWALIRRAEEAAQGPARTPRGRPPMSDRPEEGNPDPEPRDDLTGRILAWCRAHNASVLARDRTPAEAVHRTLPPPRDRTEPPAHGRRARAGEVGRQFAELRRKAIATVQGIRRPGGGRRRLQKRGKEGPMTGTDPDRPVVGDPKPGPRSGPHRILLRGSPRDAGEVTLDDELEARERTPSAVPGEPTLVWLRERRGAVLEAADRHRAGRVIVVGPVATDTDTAVEFLVEMAPSATPAAVAGLEQDLTELLGRRAVVRTDRNPDDAPILAPLPGAFDQAGREDDIQFSRKEKTPGVFEIRVERRGTLLTETYRCFYPTVFGLDSADMQDMEDLLDRMITRIREQTGPTSS